MTRWISLLGLSFSLSLPLLAAEPLKLPLWPEGAPGKMQPPSPATAEFIQKRAGKSTVTNVSEPTLTVYRPEKPNGTSVIVAPGGGYCFLSAVHEGTQVCEWLNTLGVTGILLHYRTPTRDEAAPHDKPVQDAQKALEIVRAHASEWKLDPKRVGLLGFSAGGNLLAHLACDRPTGGNTSRPDFGIMIYGGGFLDAADPLKLKSDFTVPADAPPMFLACASDDGNNPIAATLPYLEYKKQKLSAELHLFSEGGHGFGMRENKQPINQWPTRCAEWMDSMGWLPTLAKLDAAIEVERKALEEAKQYKFVCGNEISETKLRIQEIDDQLKKTDLAESAQAELKKQRTRYVSLLKSIAEGIDKNTKLLAIIDQKLNRVANLQDEREQLAFRLGEPTGK